MEESHKTKIKVGLVGAGYVSGYHIRALKTLPQVEIVGIADLNEERARQIADQYGVPAVFRSLGEMRGARPDVIHVLTPPDSHCALTLEALEMGCDVFVEKPMAPTVEECDRMIAAAQRTGRALSVNHSARLDPVILKALEMVRQGVCGDILAVDFFRTSDYPPYAGGPIPPHYRAGSYPFQDLGVHGLYLLETFLGDIRDTNVHPVATGRDSNLFFDEWHATVQCARGIGRMYISWNVRLPRNELVIHGTRGVMTIDCYLQSCIVRKTLPAPKVIQMFVAVGTSSVASLTSAASTAFRFATGKLRSSPGIHESVLRFHRALAAHVPVPVPAAEGRRIVYWMEDVSRRADAEKRARLRVSAPVPQAPILVTGGTGWLGRSLVKRLLDRGESVRVLAHRPNAAMEEHPKIHMVYGDLGDPQAVERAVKGVEVVYHVGATMRGRGWADFDCGTVQGTRNVVESCIRHGVRRMVYVSSITVLDYAGMKPDAIITEDAAIEAHPNWRGLYTQAKVAAEQIVLDAIRDRQFPAVVLRPGQIFGPGAEGVAPFGTVSLGGRWLVIGSGNLRVPLVYVEDVVDAMEAAATREGVCGSLFQLIDPTPVTQKRYIQLCQQKGTMRPVFAPRVLLNVLAIGLEALGSLLHKTVPLTRYKIRSIKSPASFDCGAAAGGLAWSPKVGTETGLKITFSEAEFTTVTANI